MTQLIHTFGESVELRTETSREYPLWRYVYGDGKPRPYFHPLCTPISGIPLTSFEPHDHTWHRGLFFTIKYVNGVNFWEEAPPFGVQVSEGKIHEMSGNRHPDRVWFQNTLHWRYPDGREAFRGVRQIYYDTYGPDAYILDWHIRLKPAEDTLLDRTPFTTWGGYGGLCVRGARHWPHTQFRTPDGQTDTLRRGQTSPWCEMFGPLDGGEGLSAGIAFFDHPYNLRHPTPFYGHRVGHPTSPMLNAAFLFHEPLTLPANADDYFLLRYRVLVHEGEWTTEQTQAAYDDYTIGEPR